MIGQTVSHYEILEKLGEGGMGVVYKALDLKLDRHVALKFLPADVAGDEGHKQRFIHEAKAASALDHPNICTVHEIDQDSEGRMFIVMAYYSGETLKRRIERGPLPVVEAIEILLQVACGLEKAHAHGLVHRDIKPANVILTAEGAAKIVDFGIAKISDVTELTRTGATVGTAAYMSPEQAQGRRADARTDVWALGVVLYELLAGRRPFQGDQMFALIHSIVHDQPEPLRTHRPEIPERLERVIHRALEKDPESRHPTAREFAEELAASRAALAAGLVNTGRFRRLLRPRILVPLAALFIVAVGWILHRQSQVRWARERAVPEVARLADQGEYTAAYRLAAEVENVVPGNSLLGRLWPEISIRVSIETDPPGAEVYMKEYADLEGTWKFLGLSPLNAVQVPRAYFRWRITKAGFQPAEGAGGLIGPNMRFLLEREGMAPPDMIRVSGGRFQGRVAGTGQLGPVDLPEYWIDKYEVTNRQFKEFVDRGGYENRGYWRVPIVRDGKILSTEQAVALFRDATGRPGPSTWEGGGYPDGQDALPVTGVSWYEAAAYAEFAGKNLPTVYHWVKVSGPGAAGYTIPLSNFGGAGPALVGSYPGISPYGVYDMAGNVREWCWNATRDGRSAAGGAWNQPEYMFNRISPLQAFDRSPANGFRCIRYRGASNRERLEAAIEVSFRDYSREKPVPETVFQIFKDAYSYERTELKPSVEAVDTSADGWIKERITFNAAYSNERVTAYLFLPRSSRPPYQTVIYFPGAGANQALSSERLLGMDQLDFVLRSGRAVLYPIYKGHYERRIEPPFGEAPGPQRDRTIHQSKDLGRSIDYLETRAEIDHDRLAYYGHSAGGHLGPIVLAIERRPKVAVFLDGGFTSHPRLPDGDVLNFAPRMTIPALMLNSRYDFIFPVESSQVPMFRALGTPESHKRHVVFDTAHNVMVMRSQVIREVLDWLDRYLGPARR